MATKKEKEIILTEEDYKKLRWAVGVIGKIIDIKDPDKQTEHSDAPLVLKIFEPINPAIKRMYGNKAQRGACDRLIKEFGLKRVLDAAELAVQAFGKEHAPLVLTPYQLEVKWSNLKSYYINKNRKQEGTESIKVT